MSQTGGFNIHEKKRIVPSCAKESSREPKKKEHNMDEVGRLEQMIIQRKRRQTIEIKQLDLICMGTKGS